MPRHLLPAPEKAERRDHERRLPEGDTPGEEG
jgi:hypothetical protein